MSRLTAGMVGSAAPEAGGLDGLLRRFVRAAAPFATTLPSVTAGPTTTSRPGIAASRATAGVASLANGTVR